MQNIENEKEGESEGSLIDDDQSLFDVESRASLASHVDWNNKREVEKYCKKQTRMADEKGFRPSEYFGAVSVD